LHVYLNSITHTSFEVPALSTYLKIFASGVLYYLLTPWSRVLLEKLTVNFAASQEIPCIYETQKYITVPTSAHHLSF
jgi:hypothetical protein